MSELLAEIGFHGLDPVLLDLPGPFDIRWYGLAYVLGFIAAAWILDRLVRHGLLPCTREAAQDLILWMVFGVLIGGRLGYLIFYKPEIFERPTEILAFWEGGLSFHGGVVGCVLGFLIFARRRKISPGRLADGVVLATTPGILLVRCANFINGELYGRVASPSVPWAIRFPTDPVALEKLGATGLPMRKREEEILDAMASGKWAEIAPEVPLRHPSQLYEALGEGLLLGLCLLVLYRMTRTKPLAPGRYGGVFLMGYAAIRFVIEYFRQPDAQFKNAGDDLGTVLGPLSMGQVLCVAMFVAGGLLFGWPRRQGPEDAGGGDPVPVAPAAE